MEKIITPEKPAVTQLWCDATGKNFAPEPTEQPCLPAPIELTLEFNYGSQYDGAKITLHYSDESFKPILDSIVSNLSERTQNEMKNIAKDDNPREEVKYLIENALLKP